MANDPPTSLRMGFGYEQARDAGVTDFQKPPPAWKMNWHRQCADAEKKIAALTRADSSLTKLALEVFEDLKRSNTHGAPQVLEMIYWHRPELTPPGYWDGVPEWALPEQLKQKR